MQRLSALQTIKTKGKRKNVFGYIPMVAGVKTKSRTNPYPQKKPDPVWIPWRLWHHPPPEKSSLRTPFTASPELQCYTNGTPPALKYQITANGNEGGRERGGQTL